MSRKLAGAAIQQVSGRAIIGFIDEIDESGIYGWAYDKLTPLAPVTLNFYIDDTWIAGITCKAFRQDVADAGHPAGEVGFRAAIPKEYCDGNPHEFFFRDEDNQNVILGGFGDGTVIVREFQLSTFFDVAFYAARYMAAGSEEGLSEYQHWKRIGVGIFPTPTPCSPSTSRKATCFRPISQSITIVFSIGISAGTSNTTGRHSCITSSRAGPNPAPIGCNSTISLSTFISTATNPHLRTF
jgi:hypothetical protein